MSTDDKDKKPQARAFSDKQHRTDRLNYVQAHRSVTKDGNYKVMAGHGGKDVYRDAGKIAASSNAKNGTAYQSQNLQKVTSKSFGGVQAHMTRDAASGAFSGSKSKNARFDSKTAAFAKNGKSATQKGAIGNKSPTTQTAKPSGALGKTVGAGLGKGGSGGAASKGGGGVSKGGSGGGSGSSGGGGGKSSSGGGGKSK